MHKYFLALFIIVCLFAGCSLFSEDSAQPIAQVESVVSTEERVLGEEGISDEEKMEEDEVVLIQKKIEMIKNELEEQNKKSEEIEYNRKKQDALMKNIFNVQKQLENDEISLEEGLKEIERIQGLLFEDSSK